MKIIIAGEIVASPGRRATEQVLPEMIDKYKPDTVISNIENLSHGKGFLPEHVAEIQRAGVECFTGGDHIFFQKDSEKYVNDFNLVIPANYPDLETGSGYRLFATKTGKKFLLINLMGRTSFGGSNSYLNDPFRTASEILEQFKDENIDARIVDFHAEATSEKTALGFYLDGKVDLIYGSHTHIPTNDTLVLPKGTLYCTDVGMTGNIDSVLGVKKEIIIELFMTAIPQRFEWEKSGRKSFRGLFVDTEKKIIERIDRNIF